MKQKIIIVSGALLCFAYIAFWVIQSINTGQPIGFDTVIREFFMQIRSEPLTIIATGITYLGNSKTIIIMCILLLIFSKTRMSFGVPLSVAALSSATIQTIIKVLIQRARPPVENFLIVQGGFSFPSGHSCSGLVFYGLFAYLLFHNNVDNSVYKLLGKLFIVLFILIGLSRIYLGVHYPTDVLGGWCLGTAILTVSIGVIQKLKTDKLEKIKG
ncbi:MAG: phosphatase PAP2 family protein [Aminipila sp.]